jgi:hypothetical protein
MGKEVALFLVTFCPRGKCPLFLKSKEITKEFQTSLPEFFGSRMQKR